jgi:hypothetical protein
VLLVMTGDEGIPGGAVVLEERMYINVAAE